MVVCDTHALVFDGLAPAALSRRARRAIEAASEAGELACADISLWEIAMLIEKGRLRVSAGAHEFLSVLIAARRLVVLPIGPEIAALSAAGGLPQGDPADRLIAATAMAYDAALITKDRRLTGLPGLATIW